MLTTKMPLFENSDLLWPVLLVSIIFWIVCIWKEWQHPISKIFFVNILVALITIGSFAMLALKPLINTSNQIKEGVLLTKNFSQVLLDSIKKLDKEIQVISYNANSLISKNLDSLSNIYILGDGVRPYDFWQFENRSVNFLGAEIPVGITRVKYPQENTLGDDLVITGNYQKAKAKHRLVLQDGNGLGIDSVVLSEADRQNFELMSPIKAVGKFVFEIIEKDSLGKPISSNPLPFKVIDRNTVKVLLINRFPTFESKYLKNYLGEMGHEVVVRSQLTKGRYKFEYFNTERTPIYALNQATLTNFDLLMIDATSFKNIPQNTRTSLEKAIKNDGLGVFIQSEASLFNMTSKHFGFSFNRDGRAKATLSNYPKLVLEKFPYVFLENDRLEKIHGTNNKIFTGYKRMQNGRLGATVFQNTFQLQLNGNNSSYRKFWSEIVSKLSKKYNSSVDWQASNLFPLKHEPFEFVLQTEATSPQAYNQDNHLITLHQDIDIQSLWRGTMFPSKEKWNQIHLNNTEKEVLDFYVIDTLAWQAIRARNTQRDNMRYFISPSENLKKSSSTVAMNLIWFFVIGVIGLGYLWLHPKLSKF